MNPFAIYFPQYYPISINDEIWGKGFTDWTLVANANLRNWWGRRAPRDGYYDGASRAVHARQIIEAKAAGLGGFAVYHYWFYSSRQLGAFEETLVAGEEEFPWFLIWASESWSKRWFGDPQIIVELDRSPTVEMINRHADYLCGCFSNPRYFRWQDKPLFVFYNLGHFSNPALVVERYRRAFLDRGFEVMLAQFIKNPADVGLAPLTDIVYLFEPRLFFSVGRLSRTSLARHVGEYVRSFLGDVALNRVFTVLERFRRNQATHSASDFVKYHQSEDRKTILSTISVPVQDVLSPGWNNTPRYGERYTALAPIAPRDFAELLRAASVPSLPPPLINAWNEWSEGAAIEPCAYLGSAYLDAITAVLKK